MGLNGPAALNPFKGTTRAAAVQPPVERIDSVYRVTSEKTTSSKTVPALREVFYVQ
jgi:hypothetical protein